MATPLYLPYEFTSVLIDTGSTDPFFAARRRPRAGHRARDAAHSGQMRRTGSVECSEPPSTETPIGVSSIV